MVNTLKKIISFVLVASCLLLSSCTTTSKTFVSDDSSSDVASTTSYLENATNTSVGTTASSDAFDENTTVKEIESESSDVLTQNVNSENFKINEDLISELGMTHLQLTEKYGESKGAYNVYVFENGYGGYGWKSYDGVYFEDMKTAGGCNMIDGINMGELFLGLTYPISFDELANKYGFCIVSVDNEITMDERYWAELSYPKYDDISFIFATTEYGCIDIDTSACIIMNMDCLQAQPISIEQ